MSRTLKTGMARLAFAVLAQRAGSSQPGLASQLAYTPLGPHSRVFASCRLLPFFFVGVVENGSYLPNLCLLFGIACVTVMELEQGLAVRNAAGHLQLAWQAKETGGGVKRTR